MAELTCPLWNWVGKVLTRVPARTLPLACGDFNARICKLANSSEIISPPICIHGAAMETRQCYVMRSWAGMVHLKALHSSTAGGETYATTMARTRAELIT